MKEEINKLKDLINRIADNQDIPYHSYHTVPTIVSIGSSAQQLNNPFSATAAGVNTSSYNATNSLPIKEKPEEEEDDKMK